MPIYAYRCENCGHAKDVLQRMADPVLTDCPACGKSTFRKQVTAAGFQLKGSGWYVTDFKGDKKPASKGDGGDKGDSPAAAGGADAAKAPTSADKGEGSATPVAPSADSAAKPAAAAKGDSAASSLSRASAVGPFGCQVRLSAGGSSP